jgi:hypothetical protein
MSCDINAKVNFLRRYNQATWYKHATDLELLRSYNRLKLRISTDDYLKDYELK